VSCGAGRIAGIAQCSSVFIEHPVRVGENASPGYHQVIPTITEEGHNFGHMRAQIRGQIQQPKPRAARRVVGPFGGLRKELSGEGVEFSPEFAIS